MADKQGLTRGVLSVVVIVAGLQPAHAEIPIEFVGQYGGPSKAVAVDGNRAYLGIGPRLAVLDVSNPSSPTLMGRSELLPAVVEDVVVSGNYAYVADEKAGLQVIDVSTPASPVLVGGYDTSGLAAGVAVWGRYAYVGDDLAFWYLTSRIRPCRWR